MNNLHSLTDARVVIVGAGQAGAVCARALRRLGFAGVITLVGDEPHPPYERPPLSKAALQADAPPFAFMWGENIASEQRIDLRVGVSVASINRQSRSVILGDGGVLPFDALVLATGGVARELPGLPADGERVFVLRTLAQARALQQRLGTVARLLVVGGGWLGLEIAASARAHGVAVTVLEREARLCARVLPPAPSLFLADLHRANGVEIRVGVTSRVERAPSGVVARIAGKSDIAADAAGVAIGLLAADGLARAAGLPCDDGILTDGCGRTPDPAIYAIGDVARLTHDGLGRSMRLELWHNANAQAELAARTIMGETVGYHEIPWFWSDQFGRRLQIVGLPQADDEVIAAETGEKPLWRLGRDGRTTSVIAVDRPRDVAKARRELARGV